MLLSVGSPFSGTVGGTQLAPHQCSLHQRLSTSELVARPWCRMLSSPRDPLTPLSRGPLPLSSPLLCRFPAFFLCSHGFLSQVWPASAVPIRVLSVAIPEDQLRALLPSGDTSSPVCFLPCNQPWRVAGS